jgi:four helix bundle protein
MGSEFRFQDLAIWQRAAKLAIQLDDVASVLEAKKKFRFAEQLRAAALSISNNIAEGSGSNSDRDFIKFLYIARKSAFECASMLMIFQQQGYLTTEQNGLIAELEAVSRMIVSFAKSLEKRAQN